MKLRCSVCVQKRKYSELRMSALSGFTSKARCSLPVFIAHAGRRHDDDAAAAVHPGGDGPSADGEESVQREADGAAGGRPVDRDDQVDKCFVSNLKAFRHIYSKCYRSALLVLNKVKWNFFVF